MRRLGLLQLVGFSLLACFDAKLYTLNQTETAGSFRLMTVPDDGIPVPVSKTGAEIKFTPGSSTIDSDNGVLYFVGSTKPAFQMGNVSLVGVSLSTGAMVSNTAFPIVPSTGPGRSEIFEAAIAYASDLKEIVVLITDFTCDTPPCVSGNQHVLGTINPNSGEWKVVRTVSHPTSTAVQPGPGVYVPGKQTFIFQLGIKQVLTQFAYSFKTGALLNATGAQFTEFEFNPKDGMLWGHGVTMSPDGKWIVRTLSKMDPSTLKVEVVKVLSSLCVDGGNLVTLDVEKQTLYWLSSLSKDDSNSSKPFYLIGVSLANSTIVSQSLMCPTWEYAQSGPSKCPATLNYF